MENIKATDLMIGNYINYEQTTHMIVGLEKDYCSSIWIGEKSKIKDLYTHSYKNIKPIPLDEKWLVDFGFIKVEGDLFLIGEFVIDKRLDDFIYFPITRKKKVIKHVHHLQNLFKALTEKQLTI